MGQHNSPDAQRLAISLIKDAFGVVAKEVVACLIYKGPQRFGELKRFTSLPEGSLRNALRILLQHSAVDAFLHQEPAGVRGVPPPTIIYAVAAPRILSSLRAPKCLIHIRDAAPALASDWGPEPAAVAGDMAEGIVETLLEHGRMEMESVTLAVAGKLARGRAVGEDGEPDPPPAWEAPKLKEMFFALVGTHYVEQAPPANLPLPRPVVHENYPKRRGAKREPDEEEQELMADADARIAAYAKARFNVPTALMMTELEDDEETESDDGMDVDRKGAGARATQAFRSTIQRKPGTSTATDVKHEGPEVYLWRVNTDEFERRFRHAAFVELATEKLGSSPGLVLRALLHATWQFEEGPRTARSAHVGEEEVEAALHTLHDAEPHLELPDDVEAVLNALADDDMDVVHTLEGANGRTLYCVDMEQMVSVMRLKALEAMVRDRFALIGLRVFRLLLLQGQMEQKEVAHYAMAPIKDVRELLYSMMRAGYVGLQDVPTSANHAPSRTFYTWKVNFAAAQERVACELYKAMGNLRTRLATELHADRAILQKIDECSVKGTGLEFNLTPEQQARIVRIQKVISVLETSIVRLDDLIMLFNDF